MQKSGKVHMLDEKIATAQSIIAAQSVPICVCWTGGGKDSAVLLHLVEQTLDNFPPLLFIDSASEFPETYAILDQYRKTHSVFIETARMCDELEVNSNARCSCTEGKIQAIERAVLHYDLRLIAVGIRRDEHEARAEESFIHSYETHERIHPILQFTEADVWKYIEAFGLEVNPLYKKGYRSLGCFRCTVMSQTGDRERGGRATEKEGLMAELRERGYF